MKHSLSKLLSALLIAVFLLSPIALMEEEIEVTEPVDEVVEEQSVDIVEEDTLGEDDEVYTYTGETYAAAPSDELFATAGEVTINATNFPDAGFRSYVEGYDSDHNGGLSASEIASVVSIDGYMNATDLTGIKYFTSLQKLNVPGTVTSLDVSGLTSLTELACNSSHDYPGKLATLNVSGCANLKILNCSYNQLTSLSVSGLSNLTSVYCGDNQISWINVDGCASLVGINCENNLMTPDALSYIGSACPKFSSLYCSGNHLTSLNLSGLNNLTSLNCANNQLTSLNLSGLTKLEDLYCNDNQLTSLNISNCKNLTCLWCGNNKLTSLNIGNCKNLTDFRCGNNKLKKLDISSCATLVKCYTKGKHTTANGLQRYEISGLDLDVLEFDKGVTLNTKAGKSSSSSSSKTKLASKKQKVNAYVGTPVQMDTNGETGKSFKSSNKKIATVNSAGVVTPKKAGKCKITYKTASASYTVTLTVKDLTIPKYVVLNLKGTIAAKVGEPQTLTATMNDGAVSKLKWTTSNKKIATVKNGVVKFKKKGTVTITVTTVKGNKKAKVKFKVTK